MALLGKASRYRLALLEEGGRLTRADETARLEQHDDDHGEAEKQHAIEFRREFRSEDDLEEIHSPQQSRAAAHDDGSDRDTRQRTHAAQDDDSEDDRRFQEHEGFRRDEALA